MTEPQNTTREAAGLRARGISAARAGRLQEARAAFLASLEYDSQNASTFLWLAGVAASEREAYQWLNRARQLAPDHPQLARIAEGIHQHFARRRQGSCTADSQAAPVSAPTVPLEPPGIRPGARLEETREGRERISPQDIKEWLGGAASVFLRLAWRLATLPILLVATVFLVSLVVELGREGDLRTLPALVPQAASFTASYLKGLAQGNMGVVDAKGIDSQTTASLRRNASGISVIEELRRALPISLGLLAAALVLAALLGLALGIGVALRRSTRLSGVLLFASVLGISTPSFFAAMLLIWFGVWLYRKTGAHFFPISGFGWDAHLLLPAIVLAARPAATMARLSYNALVEILQADYVRTAVAKGLVPRLILWRHVLRNAGVPILTTMGVSTRFSLAVLPIVEYIFSWPGIGRRLLEAIHAQDATVVVGMTLPLVLLFALANLLLEVLYPIVDPRLRNPEGSAA